MEYYELHSESKGDSETRKPTVIYNGRIHCKQVTILESTSNPCERFKRKQPWLSIFSHISVTERLTGETPLPDGPCGLGQTSCSQIPIPLRQYANETEHICKPKPQGRILATFCLNLARQTTRKIFHSFKISYQWMKHQKSKQ